MPRRPFWRNDPPLRSRLAKGMPGRLINTPEDGAGTHTYTIELDVPAGASGTLTSNVNEIMLTELKK